MHAATLLGQLSFLTYDSTKIDSNYTLAVRTKNPYKEYNDGIGILKKKEEKKGM